MSLYAFVQYSGRIQAKIFQKVLEIADVLCVETKRR